MCQALLKSEDMCHYLKRFEPIIFSVIVSPILFITSSGTLSRYTLTLYLFLAALGLSCSTQDLSLWSVGSRAQAQ